MHRKLPAICTLLALFGGFASTPAQAILSRAWVSGGGTDVAGCGPIATPCRSLQYTHDNVIAAGGEIDVLDNAGYGSLRITKSLTVISNGALAGVLATSGNNGITIAAGATDKIFLRGLTIEGAGVGMDGINFTTGASLVIDRCFIQGFTGNGISIVQPLGSNASAIITRTTANNNGAAGILLNPDISDYQTAAGLNAAIDGNTFGNNGNGVEFDVAGFTEGGQQLANRRFISVSNTTAANNAQSGIRSNAFIDDGDTTTRLFIDASRATGNSNSGIAAPNFGNLYVGRSLSSQNDYGTQASTYAHFYSFDDNKIGGNREGDNAGSAPTIVPLR